MSGLITNVHLFVKIYQTLSACPLYLYFVGLDPTTRNRKALQSPKDLRRTYVWTWPTLPCPDCFMTMLWMVPPPFHYLLFSILFLSQAIAIFFAALPWKNSAAISLDVSQLQNMENQFWVLSSICVQKNGMLTILFINC